MLSSLLSVHVTLPPFIIPVLKVLMYLTTPSVWFRLCLLHFTTAIARPTSRIRGHPSHSLPLYDPIPGLCSSTPHRCFILDFVTCRPRPWHHFGCVAFTLCPIFQPTCHVYK
ncbi:uncharacterized protein EDB91DRAFT_1142712 [Suillus paluster]|uniref:uncharacterized protein n=1 Tax=Suillus paluster TaxID=48578 RepID=UPI001B85CE18|nr:uncharacterized protein EDB91DRAFT_1142712 [Suillus paluster]KAG1736090.1 hypothetical protein EDB91DRAFT_1142712 [Suillus paluster]